MCGIVGFVGDDGAVPALLQGLRRLEYRGYDSAGVACVTDAGLEIRRAAGKLSHLEKALQEHPIDSAQGVGHTRWATHGRPNETNAHPHAGAKGRLAVVHNGIVENYLSLREQLGKQGVVFKSETDSEVLAHLIERELKPGVGLAEAMRKALKHVEGSYAVAVVSADHPGEIVAARLGSPLVIGVAQGRHLIASDIPALLEHTRDVVFLDDHEVASIRRGSFEVSDLEGRLKSKSVQRVNWDAQQAEKNGYPHFMLKEIFEQPRVIEDTLRGRILKTEADVFLEGLPIDAELAKQIKSLRLIACGTSWHAGLLGKFLIEDIARLPVEVDYASEFRYRDPILGPGDLVVGISQSGETADTLAALRLARAQGARTLAICNVVGSTMTREAEGTLYTHAGPEIGVASTKAFSAQICALFLMAVYLGRRRGSLDATRAGQLLSGLRELPRQIEKTLKLDAQVKAVAERFKDRSDFLFLGRGLNYPMALEGALKLKEISYIHAEGYPAGEMKHGPIALIDERMPVVAIAPQGRTFDKMVSNIEEAKARQAQVIAIVSQGENRVTAKADAVLNLPLCDEIFSPFLAILPLQLLAYHMAVLRGCDVDQPRNLAKSVTVE